MRLLHTNTLQLHEFSGSDVPPYVILSHTWGEEEISLQEMRSITMLGANSGNNRTSEKQGYRKIVGCCRTAAADGFEYVWIDTCCIDKTSSAELSEAINSMYRW